jgi:transposase
MPRGFALSDYEKGQIDLLVKQGLSHRKIAKKLNRSLCVVNNYLRDPSTYNTIKRKGRKPVLKEREKRAILRKASNSTVSCPKIIDDLCLKVSRWTVNRVINNSGNLIYAKKTTTPALTEQHKAKRLEWARAHMTWDKEWEKVVWSDEKKFNLDGPDGFNYYWHDLRKEKIFSFKRNMGGGSVMVWAAFGHNGKSDIVFIDKRMDSNDYKELLESHLDNIRKTIGSKNLLFQQDNAPIHRANATKDWFRAKKIQLLEWPALSPDLNPIENMWGILARRVYADGKQYVTVEELQKAIKAEWAKISIQDMRSLTTTMPNRIFELIRLEGGKTNY